MCVCVCMCVCAGPRRAPVFEHQCLLGREVSSSAPGLRSRRRAGGAHVVELVFLLACGLLHRRRPFYNVFLPAFTFLNSGSSNPLAEGAEALMGAGLFLSSWRGAGCLCCGGWGLGSTFSMAGVRWGFLCARPLLVLVGGSPALLLCY